jgi:AraC-like DNA-binding protein
MAFQLSAAGEGSVGVIVAQCQKYFTWDDATGPDPTDYYSYCPTSWPILRFVGDRLLPGKAVGLHKHPCVAMHGCLHGPVTLTTSAGDHLLETGTFYMLGTGVRHGWRNDGPHSASRISFLIDAETPGSWPAWAGVEAACRKLNALVRGLHRFDAAGNAALQTVFWQLADCLEAAHREPVVTMGLLWTFIGLVLERLDPRPQEMAAQADPAHQIQRLLMAQFGERLTIADIAEEVGLSPTQAKRVFRQAYGCGIMTYFDRLKVQQAKRLLCDPALSIKQISRMLGYSTPSYFAHVFQRRTGELPHDFRNRGREP